MAQEAKDEMKQFNQFLTTKEMTMAVIEKGEKMAQLLTKGLSFAHQGQSYKKFLEGKIVVCLRTVLETSKSVFSHIYGEVYIRTYT